MFRYIAFVWPVSQSRQSVCSKQGERPYTSEPSAAAQRLSAMCQQRAGWTAASRRPGLHVFTTGCRNNSNQAQVLNGGACLVLGTLFRRVEFDSEPSPHASLSESESEDIQNSGGRTLIERFWGRYIAFLQTSSGSTAVLRDPSGTLPCFQVMHQGVTIFFSWLEDLIYLLGEDGHWTVDWEVIRSRFLHGPPSGRQTALAEISQILPGERLDVETGTSTLLWSAVNHARAAADMEAADATRLIGHAVRSCVRSWASCYDTLLLRLSGGVDSSIMLSCLASGRTPADVICVNYFSAGSNTDERSYAMLAAARAGRDLIARERDPSFQIESMPSRVARMPYPVSYAGAMNTSTDSRLAEAHQAGAVFTGAGGDQLFFEFHSWWPAADYLHDKGIDLGFFAAAMDAARIDRLSVWRTIRLAMREHLRPDLASRTAPYANDLLSSEFADRARVPGGALRYAHPALRDASDLPPAKYAQTAALMHPVGYYDPFERAAAPEGVRPLFSQPLVELCLRLPTYLLTRGGRGRALARRAFASELPPEISNRRSKGGTEEFLKAVLDGNRDYVRGLLLDGELNRRGIIDRANLEAVLSGKPTTLRSSPGRIHDLVAVEVWLSQWTR